MVINFLFNNIKSTRAQQTHHAGRQSVVNRNTLALSMENFYSPQNG